MAHFAKLDENNNVIGVHVVNNDVIMVDGVESEQAGIDFLSSLHGYTNWKQTSYNNRIRKNYAGVGYKFDPTKGLDGAFIPPKIFNSWILDEETCQWNPPVPYPADAGFYFWSEADLAWAEVVEEDIASGD